MGFPTPSSCHALFIAPLPTTTTATNALSSSLHGGYCQPLRRRHVTVSRQRQASRRRSHFLPLSAPVHMHAKSRKKKDVQSSERPDDDLNVDLKSSNNTNSSSSSSPSTTKSKQSSPSQPQPPSQQDQMLPPPILPTLTTLTNSTSSGDSRRSDEEELVSSIASLTSPGAASSGSADASSNSNSILPQDPQLAQMGAGFSQKEESELVKFLKETLDEFQIIEWTPFTRIIRLTILVIVVIIVSTASLYVIDGFLTRVANYAFRDLF